MKDNPLLYDAEACDLIHQLIHWGYDLDQIQDAYKNLEEIAWERNNEDNFVG